ncbi:uncharacterized protein LOC114272527 isoform X2 [Camellia sinensis]|uniref:uncharacterized protein LOC114272527 isoform X2 n=1 Tax=Camellia sinensis TaxID=4442 RepID=UPI001035FAF8|nr:uncharacterized protein LOC114272527 isoform X2 [Camellia sinensis]
MDLTPWDLVLLSQQRERERSLMECVRQELKHELLQGYKEKLVDNREEILRKRRVGKLPGDTTSVLKAWWQSHSKWPYPTEARVRFIGFGSDDDEWVNVKKAIREHSLPLEHSECEKLEVGDLVLYFQDSTVHSKKREIVAVTLALLIALLLLGISLIMYLRKRKRNNSQLNREGILMHKSEQGYTDKTQKEDLQLPLFDLIVIADSTNNFSINKKHG